MIEDINLDNFFPKKPKINDSYFRKFKDSDNSDRNIQKDEVINCVKTVMDPEIPVNIYDLGLIYSINIADNNVDVEMTLTNPNCPVAGEMPVNVGKSIEKLAGLKSVKVKIVWEPTWTKELMSEDAKLALDIF